MKRDFLPIEMKHGPDWPNPFMLAPLTNQQSNLDGTLSDAEYDWLTKRAKGGFGLTMTCASHVSERGVGFPGQLGIWGDKHLDGLKRLADGLSGHGTHSVVQLHHAGMRTPHDLIDGPPECPSDNAEFGAKALSLDDVERVKDDFVSAAKRAEAAGFNGVELHGAHGYLLCQFISPEINQRRDIYGGSLENRSRILFELVARIRAECGPDFSLGVRLSPERFGLRLSEILSIAQRLMTENTIDYLDMSLWDVFKEPEEDAFKGTLLLDYFTRLDRRSVKLGAAGKITCGVEVLEALERGLDFVIVGRSAILHHDFPRRVMADADFKPSNLPVSSSYLKSEGLGDAFIEYMRRWKGFVS